MLVLFAAAIVHKTHIVYFCFHFVKGFIPSDFEYVLFYSIRAVNIILHIIMLNIITTANSLNQTLIFVSVLQKKVLKHNK